MTYHPDYFFVLYDLLSFNRPAELRLNDNALSGVVPNQISRLENLAILTLENNDLSGALPSNVCRLTELQVLTLDCDALGCECCTSCSEDVAGSTVAPTVSPTTLGTASPTNCEDAVNVFSTCYASGEDIVTALSNCNPLDDDWIGLYPSSDDLNDLPNPDIWSWACGTQFCRESVTTNSIALNDEHAGNDWPLEEGTYRVILARNSAQPYTAYAASSEFRVSESC